MRWPCSSPWSGPCFGRRSPALTPSLARTEPELAAANTAASTIESLAAVAAPALAGLLLAATGVAVVFLLCAGSLLWSAALLTRLPQETRPPRHESERASAGLLAGFRLICARAELRRLLLLYGAVSLVYGALTVLTVVCALQLLDLGAAGIGYLTAAIGAGGILGALVPLAQPQRLQGRLGLGLVLFGAPIALLGLLPHLGAALVLLAIVGLANTIVDVTAYTLIQQTVANELLGRVFGVLGSLTIAMIACGAALAPLALATLGTQTTFLAFGGCLAATATLARTRPTPT